VNNPKLLTVIIWFALFIVACHNPKRRVNEISKIDIATGGYLGDCPSIAISIDSSLTYKYYGGSFSDKQGYYTGKVTQAFWDSLNIKLEQIKFKRLDTNFTVPMDAPETELKIHFNSQTRHIQTGLFGLPASIANVFRWLINSYHQVKLYPSKDKLQFETEAQREPPKPSIKVVKFPQPVKRHNNK